MQPQTKSRNDFQDGVKTRDSLTRKGFVKTFSRQTRFAYRDSVDAWYNGVVARKEAGGHITPKSVFANSHATVRKNLDSLIERFGGDVSMDVFENASSEAPVRISLDKLRAMPLLSKEQILEAIREQADRTAEERSGGSGRKGIGDAG